jgi:glycerophosphoryl diester phosphodiesterase
VGSASTSRSSRRACPERSVRLHGDRKRAVPGRAGGDADQREPSRILRYDLQTGRLDREYLYNTDPIFQPPVPPTNFAVNGIVELLPFNNEHLLSMERSFSVGVPGTGNEIKLYSVALPGATNVLGVPSLAGLDVRPAQKTLLFDLGSLGIPLDNVEGMTLGPKLPDGRQSLVLVSDNNFAASQFTQFLLFALS